MTSSNPEINKRCIILIWIIMLIKIFWLAKHTTCSVFGNGLENGTRLLAR